MKTKKTFRQRLAEKLMEEKINKTLSIMEITEDWKKLKRDAMAAFLMAGLSANPSLTYLKPAELATKAIELADELEKQLNTVINPV